MDFFLVKFTVIKRHQNDLQKPQDDPQTIFKRSQNELQPEKTHPSFLGFNFKHIPSAYRRIRDTYKVPKNAYRSHTNGRNTSLKIE